MTDRFSTPVDGVDLFAEPTDDGWRVTLGSKIAVDKYIDLAVAKATGSPAPLAMEIVKRLFPPTVMKP